MNWISKFLERFYPTPASHGRGAARAMLIAYYALENSAKKKGEVGLTRGDLAIRALGTRPGWIDEGNGTFRNPGTGLTETFNRETDTIESVVRRIVPVEVIEHLLHAEGMPNEQKIQAVSDALDAVSSYFGERDLP